MEATNTSRGVADPSLETVVFFERGDTLYYRDAETSRVFKIDIDYRRLADSLNSDADDADDAAGVAKWTEVTNAALVGARELREDGLPSGVADDLHELADEIEAHVEAHPLPRLVH
jgi:hypothetical protein